MSRFKQHELILDHRFDRKHKRHYLNGQLSVLHCHHYTSLYTQLALDAEETQILADSAEEAFYGMLLNCFDVQQASSPEDRIDLACQYYAAIGLGKMQVNNLGDDSGEVELLFSHVDSGWLRKWGSYEKPVNYISAGYINAMFAAILGEALGTFTTSEVQSIVMGAETSLFNVLRS